MTKWGDDIPMDVAIKILELLQFHDDFMAFKSVCNRWRSAAKEAKFRACVLIKSLPWSSSSPSLALPHDHHHLPWLIVSTPDDHPNHDHHSCVYNLCHRTIKHFEIFCSYDQVIQKQQRGLILSSCGWLLSVTMELGSSNYTDLSLFNPYSGAIIQLPGLHIWGLINVVKFKKFILSSSTICPSDDYSVALILEVMEPYLTLSKQLEIVVSLKKGDDQWDSLRMLKKGDGHGRVHFLDLCCDITFYRGDFYAVDGNGDLLAFQPGKAYPRFVAEFQNQGLFGWSDVLSYTHIFYLVESMGRLLLLSRVRSNENFETISFQVFEVNVENGDAKEVHNLGGNRAVFVGINSSFSAESSHAHGCKPNRIYYTDDFRHLYYQTASNYHGRGKDYGVYNLTTKRIECFVDDISSLCIDSAPSMWLESSAS